MIKFLTQCHGTWNWFRVLAILEVMSKWSQVQVEGLQPQVRRNEGDSAHANKPPACLYSTGYFHIRWIARTSARLHIQELQRMDGSTKLEISSLQASHYPSDASAPCTLRRRNDARSSHRVLYLHFNVRDGDLTNDRTRISKRSDHITNSRRPVVPSISIRCRRACERRPLLHLAGCNQHRMGLKLLYLSCSGKQPTIGYISGSVNN